MSNTWDPNTPGWNIGPLIPSVPAVQPVASAPNITTVTASSVVMPTIRIDDWILVAAWRHLETQPDTPVRRLRMDALTDAAGGAAAMLRILAADAEGRP